MHHRLRTAALAAALLALAPLAGCATDPWQTPHPAPTAEGSPAPGFLPSPAPSPEATIAPRPGSWDGVRPSAGYRVVLLTAGQDAPSRTLADAVRRWGEDERVELRTIPAGADPVDAIVEAIALRPDLIVSAGNGLIEALTLVSASHLDQQFLVVGAEVPEPTHNVTAVDWTGGSFRGQGLGASSPYDPETFTPERCLSGVRAGVAAVLSGLTGIVLWID